MLHLLPFIVQFFITTTLTHTTFMPIVAKEIPPVYSPDKGVVVLQGDPCEQAARFGAEWVPLQNVSPVTPCANGVQLIPTLRYTSDVSTLISQKPEAFIGFSEPDQTGISPIEAAEYWRKLEIALPSAYKVAPAPSDSGSEWLRQFVEAYVGLYGRLPQMDAIAMHCYLPSFEACRDRAAFYKSEALSWGVPEVWVTEYSFGPGVAFSVKWAEKQMTYFVLWIAADPMVTRYAHYAVEIPNEEVGVAPTDDPILDWRAPLWRWGKFTSYGLLYRRFPEVP